MVYCEDGDDTSPRFSILRAIACSAAKRSTFKRNCTRHSRALSSSSHGLARRGACVLAPASDPCDAELRCTSFQESHAQATFLQESWRAQVPPNHDHVAVMATRTTRPPAQGGYGARAACGQPPRTCGADKPSRAARRLAWGAALNANAIARGLGPGVCGGRFALVFLTAARRPMTYPPFMTGRRASRQPQ